VVSFAILIVTGCVTYFGAAVALDIAGLRKPVLAFLREGRLTFSRQGT
jgi:hypothetical protein